MDEKKLALVNTYGFDLENILKEARENGNTDFADLAEVQITKLDKAIKDVQTVYDVIAHRHTSCEGEPLWKIGADGLQEYLNK